MDNDLNIENSPQIDAIIVDDEEHAHSVLKHHLQEHGWISIVKHCYDATQALSYLSGHSPKLMFLDINMPGLSGIELLKVLNKKPQTIITSAYKEFALEGFELDVTDYLLKPIGPERLSDALDKVAKRLALDTSASEHIMLKVDRGKQKFYLNDVIMFEGCGNFVKVWTQEGVVLSTGTLKRLENALPKGDFVRVHRSYIVNKQHIQTVNPNELVMCNGEKMNVGGIYKDTVKSMFDGDR